MVAYRLFGVFAVWLDDETLQKQEVYLPTLPPEYEPHRLAQVMQRQQVGVFIKNKKSDDTVFVSKMLLHQVIHTFNLCHYVLVKELWLELVDQERLQYDEKEVLSLWEKVQSEPPFLQAQNPGFTDYTSLSNGTEHKLMMWIQKIMLHLTKAVM